MKIYNSNNITTAKLGKLFNRPAISADGAYKVVKPIIADIIKQGHKSVIKYAKKYDNLPGENIVLTQKDLSASGKKISKELKTAIKTAARNIQKFHLEQKPKNYEIETMPGIKCSRKYLPIENVGLYIPGGSAVLLSTMLMLGIPANIAGCKRVVVCSPSKNGIIHPAVAYSAFITGVDEFYTIGGAHAIAMMAYGTDKVKKVDKIFGPGNQYVTAAKTLVSIDPNGCSIDMPAGPSEVLVIADKYADPSFIAADLLSQAEHGTDSQVILLTTDKNFAELVLKQLHIQLNLLPRKNYAEGSLKSSFVLVVKSIEEAIDLSNKYAPEHLIINVKKSEKYISKIQNAGSVFIGGYTPESVGDYASGTNHSLPTYGYARSMGGVSVESFMKPVTFQSLTKEGLKRISKTVIKIAETEKLEAHANAVKIRLNK